MEEQSLADGGFHRFRLEGLGDQEGWLRLLAREQALREGGDEDHGHAGATQDVIHGIDAGGSVSKLDIGQHQARTVLPEGGDSFRTPLDRIVSMITHL